MSETNGCPEPAKPEVIIEVKANGKMSTTTKVLIVAGAVVLVGGCWYGYSRYYRQPEEVMVVEEV